MNVTIREMKREDWSQVSKIYKEGMETGISTFQSKVPSYIDWSFAHLEKGRYVAVSEDKSVVGWVALTPASSRSVYNGVMEVSVYIAADARGCDVGTQLLHHLIKESEKLGIWMLQSNIFVENEISIALHKKCGFRLVGMREKIGKDASGMWHSTYLLEKRTELV